jgi:hypothetical protein
VSPGIHHWARPIAPGSARSNPSLSDNVVPLRPTPHQYLSSLFNAGFASGDMPQQSQRLHSSLTNAAMSSAARTNVQSAHSYQDPFHLRHAHGPSPTIWMSVDMVMHLQRNSQHYRTRTTQQLYALHNGRGLLRRSFQMLRSWYIEDLERADQELAMAGERWVYRQQPFGT